MEIKMKRYAVLLCAEDSEYIKKVHGGYFQVFKSLLGDEDQGDCNGDHQEIWNSYKASNGELPKDDDEIAKYDGFIITGSIHDAHGNDLWVLELVHLLKKLDFMKKKVLGICFGHQIWELPPKAELLASSEKTGVEMFKYGEHMMGIQGHPEYTKDIVLHIIGRLLNSNVIQTWQADAAKLKLEAREPDQEAWKKLCKGFLKG
ncbi:putative glutamine synthetase protein [Dioscorea alata]|uniref:Glutamine synthetase protein n=1 Tax=Dioscorea alata TaxID=55571 RepID=A0ACB7UNH4_DIOAL|nr:putative glutamine synthetase protein [Dioscorea alata]